MFVRGFLLLQMLYVRFSKCSNKNYWPIQAVVWKNSPLHHNPLLFDY